MKDVKSQLTETVREEAEVRADQGRREIGRVVVDLSEEHFPEAVRQRRRKDIVGGFVTGVAIGFLVRSLLD